MAANASTQPPRFAGVDGRSTNERGVGIALLAVGGLALVGAFVARPHLARAASSQDWSPFVLVTGLLLVGCVADGDGLFDITGRKLAQVARDGRALYLGAVIAIGVVTAVLNLDTSVAFLTPVLIYTARSRGGGEEPLLYGTLLLSNAASLFLPGSNLTNLIVFGTTPIRGGAFFGHMVFPALAALLTTAVVIAVVERRSIRSAAARAEVVGRPEISIGLVAVVVSALFVVILGSPALPVACVGLVAVLCRVRGGRLGVREVTLTLGLPTLVGLFGLAVGVGTVGRSWSGPSTLLAHLDTWGTAGFAAICSVFLNNLPAASLLAARRPTHPFALLIGLNLGPNLAVSGSLAWILWLRAARLAGAHPSIGKASAIGAVAVPVSMAAAVFALSLTR